MIDNLAFGGLAARSGARVLTAVTNAGPIRRTIRIQDTLGTATLVGIAKVILDAGTRPGTVLLPTDGIGPARTGHTRGLILFGDIGLDELAAGEWIARVSFLARAARRVVDHCTARVEAARSRTRVGTLLPDAGLILGALVAEHTLRTAIRWRSDVIR